MDGSQRVVASGLNGPNADAFVNGSLYVALGGAADRNFHTLVKMDPLTGAQTPVGSSQPDNGNVTAASANTLTNAHADWNGNSYSGWNVVIVDGTGEGEIGQIASNTATQLTLSSNWNVTPDSTSRYTLGFAVPVGMGKIPGDNNDIYIGDEGGGINYDHNVKGLSGEYPGAVWKVNLTSGAETIVTYGNSTQISPIMYGNKLTAVLHGPYGMYPPADRTDNPDYGNMSDMAVDPNSGNIIALNTGAANSGGYGSLVGVDPHSGPHSGVQSDILSNGLALGQGLDGVTVAPGIYGPETIFTASGNTTGGTTTNGQVTAVDPNLVQPPSPVSSSGYLANVGGMISYQDTLTNFVDFETGDFSQTASQMNAAITSAPGTVLDGMHSLQLSRNNGVAWAEIRQSGTTYFNLPTAFYSFEFQYASQTGEDGVVNFKDNTGMVKAVLHLGADGKLRFYDASNNLLGVGPTSLNPNLHALGHDWYRQCGE